MINQMHSRTWTEKTINNTMKSVCFLQFRVSEEQIMFEYTSMGRNETPDKLRLLNYQDVSIPRSSFSFLLSWKQQCSYRRIDRFESCLNRIKNNKQLFDGAFDLWQNILPVDRWTVALLEQNWVKFEI